MLPDLTGPDRIGSYLRNLKTRTFAELLIDLRGGPDLAGRARRHAEGGRSLSHAPTMRADASRYGQGNDLASLAQ